MNLKWNHKGHVAPGGTALDITIDSTKGRWVASPAGLYRKQAGRWLPVHRDVPFLHFSALISAGKTLFAAGLPGGVMYTVDSGEHWHQSWIDQVQSPVTCFGISPSYSRDHVLLAGTQEDGILRSTDGGRHWELSNFGLRGFAVFDLVTVGVPQVFRELKHLKDMVFAATEDGVYYSPNCGRAWRPAGMETAGSVVLSLALSTDYENDQTLYAGTESGALLRSCDGGGSWESLEFGPFYPGAVNSLHCGDDSLLVAGTSDAGILRSIDGGVTWEQILRDVPPVMKLKQVGTTLYAGLHEAGLLTSSDEGKTWCPEQGLALRRFEWLSAPARTNFVVAGPQDGIWISKNTGDSWEPAPGWPVGKTVSGLAAGEGFILAAGSDGIWRSGEDGLEWVPVLDAGTISPDTGVITGQFYLVCRQDHCWGAGQNGVLWHSSDRGQNWAVVETPFRGLPVIALAISSHSDPDITLAVSIADQAKGTAALWRAAAPGFKWTLWQTEKADWFFSRLAIESKLGAGSFFSLGGHIYQSGPNGWHVSREPEDDAAVTTLAFYPTRDLALAAVTDHLLVKAAGDPWTVSSAMDGQALVDLQFISMPGGTQNLVGLTSDGVIWQCDLKN